MTFTKLYSQGVDYAKNGNPVEIHNNLPKLLINFKTDWHKAEVTGARELDYYVSERALEYMFRKIELLDPEEPVEGRPTPPPQAKSQIEDSISHVLAPLVQHVLDSDPTRTMLSQTRRVRMTTRNNCMSTMFVRCGTYA